MTKAITVRLDDGDHAAMHTQAEELHLRPGTLARILMHAGLSESRPGAPDQSALAALERLVQRSRTHEPADAVELVKDSRAALEPRR